MAAVAHRIPASRRRPAVVPSRVAVAPSRVAGAPARMSRPGAVYRRRRLAAALVVVCATAAFLLALHGLRPALPGSGRAWAPSGVYVVQPGDTFWDIAGRVQPGRDPRPLVAQLVAAHGSTVLLPGDRIALPPAA